MCIRDRFDIRDGNNGENFSGLAKVLNSTEVQITNPSITSIVGVSMPEEGILTINGREYAYEGFKMCIRDSRTGATFRM